MQCQGLGVYKGLKAQSHELHVGTKEIEGLPLGTSVSLSASESDGIAFLRFIRKTSSSLSLPLADSKRAELEGVHNHIQAFQRNCNFMQSSPVQQQIKKYDTRNNLYRYKIY